MSLTNFQISRKTKAPACCSFACCGNRFGRIERSCYRHDSRPNKIIRTRRYAKHCERQLVRKEILQQLRDDADYIQADIDDYNEQLRADYDWIDAEHKLAQSSLFDTDYYGVN